MDRPSRCLTQRFVRNTAFIFIRLFSPNTDTHTHTNTVQTDKSCLISNASGFVGFSQCVCTRVCEFMCVCVGVGGLRGVGLVERIIINRLGNRNNDILTVCVPHSDSIHMVSCCQTATRKPRRQSLCCYVGETLVH